MCVYHTYKYTNDVVCSTNFRPKIADCCITKGFCIYLFVCKNIKVLNNLGKKYHKEC